MPSTWTTPKDWAFEEGLESSEFNTHIRDNLKDLRGPFYDSGYLGAPGSPFTVASIPATYTSLRLVFYGRGTTGTTTGVLMYFNADFAGNYDWSQAYQFGSSGVNNVEGTAQGYLQMGLVPGGAAPADRFGCMEILIPCYSGTSSHKPCMSDWGSIHGTATDDKFTGHAAGLWRSTAAINQVQIGASAGQFATGSRLQLFTVA